MSILDDVLADVLKDVPEAVAIAVVTLVGGIVRIVRAGDDPQQQLDALMTTAEQIKGQIDRAKFG